MVLMFTSTDIDTVIHVSLCLKKRWLNKHSCKSKNIDDVRCNTHSQLDNIEEDFPPNSHMVSVYEHTLSPKTDTGRVKRTHLMLSWFQNENSELMSHQPQQQQQQQAVVDKGGKMVVI